jgi:hypothetical protein
MEMEYGWEVDKEGMYIAGRQNTKDFHFILLE